MMTVITESTLAVGKEPQWDAAFEERLADARSQPGWVALQVLIPLDAPEKRVVVGTWRTRADWEAWHQSETFRRTRQAMNAVDPSPARERWYEVVIEAASESRAA